MEIIEERCGKLLSQEKCGGWPRKELTFWNLDTKVLTFNSTLFFPECPYQKRIISALYISFIHMYSGGDTD